MPDVTAIQQSFAGAWRLMLGRVEGLRLLDLTADGFWDSFRAIPVALPPLLVGWVAAANDVPAAPESGGGRLVLVMEFAAIDLMVWIGPLIALLAAARPTGLSDRIVPLVVAYNWGEALLAWMTLPATLLFLLAGPPAEIRDPVTLVLFLAIAMLSWRLVVTALDRGVAAGSAVFAGIFVISLAAVIGLESVFGIYSPAEPVAG